MIKRLVFIGAVLGASLLTFAPAAQALCVECNGHGCTIQIASNGDVAVQVAEITSCHVLGT